MNWKPAEGSRKVRNRVGRAFHLAMVKHLDAVKKVKSCSGGVHLVLKVDKPIVPSYAKTWIH